MCVRMLSRVPRDRLHSVPSAHIGWLSEEGQVVDAGRADICLALERCRERKNLCFHMLMLVTAPH